MTKSEASPMSKEVAYKDIPAEVWEVWMIQRSGQPIGMSTWERCNEVIKKYPQFFEWEHKYDKIPQFVHDAYKREAYSFELPMPKGDRGYIDIIPTLLSDVEVVDTATQKPMTLLEMTTRVFIADQEERKRKEAARIERKRVWDKHYYKYGLEYREE